MKNRKLLFLVWIALTAFLCIVTSSASEIEIADAEALIAVMNDSAGWSDSYRLTADINLEGKAQKPIGTYTTPFSGSFDGAGFTVSGLDIKADGTAGLFGVISGGSVSDLTVEGTVTNTFAATNAETKIDGNYPGTGGVCGVVLSGSSLTNCINRATVNGPGNSGGVAGIIYHFGSSPVILTGCENYGVVNSSLGNAGGVFARFYVVSDAASTALSVSECVNHADVLSKSADRNRVGGIVGYVRTEKGVISISGCTNEGNITGQNSSTSTANRPYVGGIAGRIEITGGASAAMQLSQCSNFGDVDSTYLAGGITAYMQRSATCTDHATKAEQCYNSGDVTGPNYAGGIIAFAQNACTSDVHSVVQNCMNIGAVNSDLYTGGILGWQYGYDMKNCYTSGTVTGPSKTSGAITGSEGGSVSCVTDAVYYLDTAFSQAIGTDNAACEALQVIKVSEAEAINANTFALLDLQNIWKMDKAGPILQIVAEHHEHSYDDGEIVVSATCIDKGVKRFTCDVCRYSYTEEYDALDHDLKETEAGIEATCETPGKTAVLACQRAGCTYTEGGEVVDALDHDMTEREAEVTATCTEPGKTAVLACQRPGCTHTEGGEVIDALDHDLIETAPAEGESCTSPGKTAVLSCQRPGCTYTEGGELVDVLGHDLVEIEAAVPATCTEPGKTAVMACQRTNCDHTEGGEVIPASGHSWGDWVETIPAQPGVAGEERRTCTVCEAFETRALSPLPEPEPEGNRNLIALVVGMNKGEYTVRFSTVGASKIEPQTVKKGKTVAEPEAPVKAGFYFAGWYRDARYQEKYDFTEPVRDDLTLYAKWDTVDPRIIMTIGSTDVRVFGMATVSDVPPVIVKDRTMLPARFVLEALGATVSWNASERKVTILYGEKGIELYIDSTTAYMDGTAAALDAAPFIREDRTYLPLRFIAEALGADVNWMAQTKTIVIRK